MTAPVKVLVCGSRTWTDRATIRAWLARLPPGTTVIHGAAKGADSIAGEEARVLGFTVRAYPADWSTHGRAAGPIRNQQMAVTEHTEAEPIAQCFAFTGAIDKEDRPGFTGTGDMVSRCVRFGIVTVVVPPGCLP